MKQRNSDSHLRKPFFTTKEAGKVQDSSCHCLWDCETKQGHLSVTARWALELRSKSIFPRLSNQFRPLRQADWRDARGPARFFWWKTRCPCGRSPPKALERSGYHILQAGSGLEALVVADRHPSEIHVVVTDIVMPADGRPEMVEKLRRKRKGSPWFHVGLHRRRRLLKMAGIGIDAILLTSLLDGNASA